MNEKHENDHETPLDPVPLLGEREDEVYGVFDNPADDIPELVSKLTALGVDRDLVQVYQGQAGLEQLKPGSTDGGVMQRIKRTIQSIGEEGGYFDLIEQELTAGHALVAVEVDEENYGSIIDAMKELGAHDMQRHGKLTIVDL